MKRNLFIAVAFFATMTASAQNIAAVSPSNETTIYQTLGEAVTKAADGSIIYLPGGGFQINDTTKISHKLTIMGVSHRGDTDNADGATVIAGNLNFVGGSDGSAVIGVFISGNINVGTSAASVTNLTVRFCNVNSLQVKHDQSSGMVVNQCYLRGTSNFGNCNVCLENNVLHSVQNINGGTIDHNIITSHDYHSRGSDYALDGVWNSSITNNFLLDRASCHNGNSCYISSNCIASGTWNEDQECIMLDDGTTWDDVFVVNKGVSISSNYHFKDTWDKGRGKATDRTDIGIYGGSGFKEPSETVAPIPRIVSKKVAEQTDGSGRLHIEVTVKSN